MVICREIVEVTEWYSLGHEIGIPKHELNIIRDDHKYVEPCRRQMLITWEKREEPSWSKLVLALKNIGYLKLANKIAQRYGKYNKNYCSNNISLYIKFCYFRC